MKLAICNEIYHEWSLEKAFQHASETGYHGIEIAPFTLCKDATQISNQQIQQTLDTAQRFGLEIVGLHWLLAFTEDLKLTSHHQETRVATARHLGCLAKICQRLLGKVMVLGSPAQRNMEPGQSIEQANDCAIDCIQRVVPELESTGVTLALEPLGPAESNYLLTAEWARQLIERINHPLVRLHLDVKAMCSEQQDIPTIIRTNRDILAHFHANDPNLRGPGMGQVDFRPILSTLTEIGYEGWVSVETFDREISPETISRESYQYLQSLVENRIRE